jgi:hypothetical protein
MLSVIEIFNGAYMKKILLTISLILMNSSAFAAKVTDVELDEERNIIMLVGYYSGGLAAHDFSLEDKGCFETEPLDCEFQLIDNRNGDTGEALVPMNVSFTLESLGLNTKRFSRAMISISGDGNSKVDFILPKIK